MSRNNSRSLATLARIKDQEERDAARRLTAARERVDRERRNLTTVQQYLAEYSQPQHGSGSHSRLLAEGQRFRLELERSLEVQRASVETAERQAESARSCWAAVRAEREAMEKLIDRRRDAVVRRRQSSEQKQSDEQAQQQAASREGGAGG